MEGEKVGVWGTKRHVPLTGEVESRHLVWSGRISTSARIHGVYDRSSL